MRAVERPEEESANHLRDDDAGRGAARGGAPPAAQGRGGESANQFGDDGLIGTAGKVWSIKSESCWIGVGPDPDGSVSAA
jgi:hypothetical protein